MKADQSQRENPISAHRSEIELLQRLYSAFNARELDVVLEHLAADVRWPNGWEGGELHGRDAVRQYWLRQWAEIQPTVIPIAFTIAPDGSTAVTVDQTVDSIQGERLARDTVTHVYRFAGGRVSAMEIRAGDSANSSHSNEGE